MKPFSLAGVVAVALLLSSYVSFAQTDTDTAFASQMNYIFANVDKSRVPSGILRDFGMEFTNLENYNGTALTDSNFAAVTAPGYDSQTIGITILRGKIIEFNCELQAKVIALAATA